MVDIQTDRGLGGVRVEVWSKNPMCDTKLGEEVTGEDGRFQVEFERSIFRTLVEQYSDGY